MTDNEKAELEKIRSECIDLLHELEKWGVKHYRKDRIALFKSIRYSRNTEHLLTIHSGMNGLLGKMMIEKMSRDLDD